MDGMGVAVLQERQTTSEQSEVKEVRIRRQTLDLAEDGQGI